MIQTSSGGGPGWPSGYEAQVNCDSPDPQRTGSLYALAPVKVQLIPPRTWFEQHDGFPHAGRLDRRRHAASGAAVDHEIVSGLLGR